MNTLVRILVLSFIAVVAATPVGAQYVFQPVAIERRDAPAIEPAQRFFALSDPGISENGEIMFGAVLFNAGAGTVDPDHGIWIGLPGALRVAIRESAPAPGVAGGQSFRALTWRAANEAGQVLIGANLKNPDGTQGPDVGLWTSDVTNTIRPLAVTGQVAPGTETDTVFLTVPYSNLGGRLRLSFTDLSEVPLVSRLTNPILDISDRDWSFWVAGPAGLNLVAREGDPAPGTSSTFRFFMDPLLANNGQVAIVGQTYGSETGIWSGPQSNLQLLARINGEAPGTVGASFRPASSTLPFTGLRMNNVGQFVFRANLSGGDASGTLGNSAGYWIGGNGSLQLALRGADPAPGVVDARFQTPSSIDLNDAGQLAFWTIISGPTVNSDNKNNTGIWAGTPGNLTLVAQASSIAPGTGGDIFQNGFNSVVQGFQSPVINERGQVAFLGRAVPAGGGSARKGIWAGAPGNLRLVIRTGDMLELAPGDTRPVADLEFSYDRTFRGTYRGFNSAGQVVFTATFADSSTSSGEIKAIFVATPLNSAPVASDGSISAEGRVPTSVTLNASDADADPLTFSVVIPPANGQLSGSGAQRTYQSSPGFVGTDSFQFRASDGTAASNIATVTISVVDTRPPVLNVPPNVEVEATAFLSPVNLGAATANDRVDGAITPTNDAPASFPLGTTPIAWTATDSSGNSANAIQLVTVVDTTPPLLTPPPDIIVEATGVSTPVVIGSAAATDVFPVELTNNAAATFPLGVTVVTWTATDENGNQATAVQAVTVQDTTPPTVIAPPNVTADATAPRTILDIGQATATDIFLASLTNDAPTDGFPVGETTVTWRAEDTSGNVSSAAQVVTLLNTPPALNPIPDSTIDEGDVLDLAALFVDSDSTEWTATVDYGDGAGAQVVAVSTTPISVPLSHLYVDNGQYQVTVDVTDAEGASDTISFVVTVNNVAPTLSNFVVAPALAQLGAHTISASVDFTDPGVLDTHTAAIDWGDGAVEPASVTEIDGSGSVTGVHEYLATGVYTVTISVTDKDGATTSSMFQFVVIYDPDGGFVTGGGWIDSPLGACQISAACTVMTGKANFGFVSKYKKGASTPTGNTEFQFRAGDLDFHSSSYDWLVIAGAQAKYKGTGTINGSGNYGFMLSALDADLTPRTNVDFFRIKIWDKDNGDFVVYDNQMTDAEDADPTTAIGGGSIKIHKAK